MMNVNYRKYCLSFILVLVFTMCTPHVLSFADASSSFDNDTIKEDDTAPITIYNYGDGKIDYFLHLDEGNMPGQIKSLRLELEARLSTEAVEEIISYVEQKTSYEVYLPAKYVYDSKSDKYIILYGDNNLVEVSFCDDEFTSFYGKKIGENKATQVAGYYVPQKTDVKVTAKKSNGDTEACFRINVDLKSYTNEKQLQDLASILLQKHSLEAVVDIITDFGSKDSSFDGLVDHWVYDNKTGKLLWIKASKRGSKYVDVYVCSDSWTKELTKNAKEEFCEIISGFIIPSHTDLVAIPSDWGGQSELWISMNLLHADYPGQIEDMKDILLQKCDKSTVDKVVKYVKKKKERFDHLDDKFFYDKKTKRYIWVMESRVDDVNVFFCSKR